MFRSIKGSQVKVVEVGISQEKQFCFLAALQYQAMNLTAATWRKHVTLYIVPFKKDQRWRRCEKPWCLEQTFFPKLCISVKFQAATMSEFASWMRFSLPSIEIFQKQKWAMPRWRSFRHGAFGGHFCPRASGGASKTPTFFFVSALLMPKTWWFSESSSEFQSFAMLGVLMHFCEGALRVVSQNWTGKPQT